MDEVMATSLGSCRSCSSWTICTSRRGTKEVIDYFSIRVTFFFCFIQDFLHFFSFYHGQTFFSLFSQSFDRWALVWKWGWMSQKQPNEGEVKKNFIQKNFFFLGKWFFFPIFYISTQALEKWYKGKTWLFLALRFLEFWVRLPKTSINLVWNFKRKETLK